MVGPAVGTLHGVSALGDVLELLHGARHRFRTVRAEVRQWSHRERRSLAVDALARSGRSHGVRMKPLSWPGGAVEPES